MGGRSNQSIDQDLVGSLSKVIFVVIPRQGEDVIGPDVCHVELVVVTVIDTKQHSFVSQIGTFQIDTKSVEDLLVIV